MIEPQKRRRQFIWLLFFIPSFVFVLLILVSVVELYLYDGEPGFGISFFGV